MTFSLHHLVGQVGGFRPPLRPLGVPVLSRPLAIVITVLVTLVWVAINAAALVDPERYDVDAGINAIFMLVLGAVLGLTPKREHVDRARRAIARRRNEVLPDGEATDDPTRGDDS